MGLIGQRLDLGPSTVRDHARTTKMVPMPVVHGAARHRHDSNASVAGLDEPGATGIRSRCIALVQFTDVPRRGRPDDLLHPSPIAVIDKGGVDRCAAKRGHGARQAIVDVKRRTGAVIPERTRDGRLVAVVVVAELIGQFI